MVLCMSPVCADFSVFLTDRLKLLSAYAVEAIVWGLPHAFGVFLNAYMQDEKYTSQRGASTLIPLIGPTSSGIMYCSGKCCAYCPPLCSRLILNSASIAASFAPISKTPSNVSLHRSDILLGRPLWRQFCDKSYCLVRFTFHDILKGSL